MIPAFHGSRTQCRFPPPRDWPSDPGLGRRYAAVLADGGRGSRPAPHQPQGHLRSRRARSSARCRSGRTKGPRPSRRAATVLGGKTNGFAGRFPTMTVKIRKYEKSKRVGLEADIRFRWPDGTWFRRRFRAPVNTQNQAQRWGEDLERRLYAQGKNGALARSRRDVDSPSNPTHQEVFRTPNG